MPRKRLDNDIVSVTCSEDDPYNSLYEDASLGGEEKLDHPQGQNFHIVFMTDAGFGGTTPNNWEKTTSATYNIGASKWIRNARLYFMISDTGGPAATTYTIRSAVSADPCSQWDNAWISWERWNRAGSAAWHGVGPNRGVQTSKQKLGANLGWHSMSLTSALRLLMRDYEQDDYHFAKYNIIGFSLCPENEEEIVVGNLLRVPDHGETDRPYIRVLYGQPAVTRIRGFGKRMLTRL